MYDLVFFFLDSSLLFFPVRSLLLLLLLVIVTTTVAAATAAATTTLTMTTTKSGSNGRVFLGGYVCCSVISFSIRVNCDGTTNAECIFCVECVCMNDLKQENALTLVPTCSVYVNVQECVAFPKIQNRRTSKRMGKPESERT